MTTSHRREFLRVSALAGAGAGTMPFGFLTGLAPVSAEEASPDPAMVMFRPEIEPVVRLLEDTPRDRLLEEVGARVKAGKLSYQEVVAALQLAGVRNIQPRPVGFKFHAVLVVNSAHIASIASPDADRWLPVFWALDYFKSSQARDVQQGDWTMAPVDEARVPSADKAAGAFVDAMENWDEAAADAAVAGLARSAGAHEVFEIFARLGSRDFRDIGHKAIFVANSWRTLQFIGWQHAEPVLRSLAYALLQHEGDNPSGRDAPADRPWRSNLVRVNEIPVSWQEGMPDPAAAASLLPVLREGGAEDASRKVLELLGRGVAPGSLWDVLLGFSSELVMRAPNILSLHAVTSANAIYYAYRTVADDTTRRLLLLQMAAFCPLFRRYPDGADVGAMPTIDGITAGDIPGSSAGALDEIFSQISDDRAAAVRSVFAFCKNDPRNADAFIAEARRLLFLKGNNTHDYKYTSAVLEDYRHLTPAVRDRYIAASVFNLKGSGHKENALVKRVRGALG